MILGLSTCFRVGLVGECIGSMEGFLRQCCHLLCWYFCNCVFSFWACPHKSFFSFFFWCVGVFLATNAWQWTLGLFLPSLYVNFAYSSNDIWACSCVWRLLLLDYVWALEELSMLSYFFREIRPWRPYRMGLLGLAIFIPPWDKSFDGHLLSVKDIYTYQSIKRNIIRLYNLFFFFWEEQNR